MSDFTEKKKHFRDEDGRVITSPKNFLTNPPKKGKVTKKTTFEPFPAFVADDYSYPKTLHKKDVEEHHEKLKNVSDKAFS